MSVTSFHALGAQSLSQLERGRRLRITAPALGMSERSAAFEGVEDGVLVAVTDSAIRLPLSSVERIEGYMGRRDHRGRGAAIGVVSGVVLGAVIGYLVCDSYEVTLGSGTGNCFDSRDGAQLGFLIPLGIGAVAGPLIGLGIGALVTTDRWEEVPLDDLRLTVLALRAGRFALAASIPF